MLRALDALIFMKIHPYGWIFLTLSEMRNVCRAEVTCAVYYFIDLILENCISKISYVDY